MNRQPLYLHAEKPLRITLKAPALYVQAENCAERIFPLRRIERVQVSGPVDWSGDALLACADQGIHIQFLNSQGQTRGRLVGSRDGDCNLASLIERLLANLNWQQHYQQWCWAVEQQTRRYAAQRLGYEFGDARQLRGLAQWSLSRLADSASQKQLGRALQWLRQELYGQISQHLYHWGIWDDNILMMTEPVDLARDMTRILQPILLIVREKQVRTPQFKGINRREVMRWSHRQAGFFHHQIERLIHRLEIWILENY